MNHASEGNVHAPYFDARVGLPIKTVLPGEHRVLHEERAALMTLLGSCVSACIRDPRSGVGGLNHFLLPHDRSGTAGSSTRYGVYAMEVLINEILNTGALRSDLEAKVFGGGNIMKSAAVETVGDRNAAFVRAFLRAEGIRVVGEDLGGAHARRVVFVPTTGRALVQHTSSSVESEICAADAVLERAVPLKPDTSIELF
jgi:chemotaxis protein CheD